VETKISQLWASLQPHETIEQVANDVFDIIRKERADDLQRVQELMAQRRINERFKIARHDTHYIVIFTRRIKIQ